MRLWHYKLIPVLPNKMLVSQWRECIAIKRQWEKGTLKHPLVSYVMNYDKLYFLRYVELVVNELNKRKIKHQKKYYDELFDFCYYPFHIVELEEKDNFIYKEHNNRYLAQCYYNLEEKYDRGIITLEEKFKINEKLGEMLD